MKAPPWLLAAYTAGVVTVTLVPVPETVSDALPSWLDKAVHAGLFGCLAVLLYWHRVPAGRPGLLNLVGPVVALAGLIELAQGPLPHRTGDLWDFAWGIAGAVVGYLAARAGERTCTRPPGRGISHRGKGP